jgi:hypothetical protein
MQQAPQKGTKGKKAFGKAQSDETKEAALFSQMLATTAVRLDTKNREQSGEGESAADTDTRAYEVCRTFLATLQLVGAE